MPRKRRIDLVDVQAPMQTPVAWIFTHWYAPALTKCYRQGNDFLLSHAPKTGTLWDIGCGPGHALEALLSASAQHHVIGIDPAPTMIQFSQRKLAHHSPDRWALHQLGAEGIQNINAPMDGFTAFGVIKHWKNPKQIFQMLLQQLRPGGAYYLTELNKEAPDEAIESWLASVPVYYRYFATLLMKYRVLPRSLSLSEFQTSFPQSVKVQLSPDQVFCIAQGIKEG